MKRNPQLKLFKDDKKFYGGSLRTTRKSREMTRPLSTQDSMHLVMRSSKAVDEWSFRKPKHEREIERIVKKFSTKFGVKILSLGNVGNHLHFHIRLGNRYRYKPLAQVIFRFCRQLGMIPLTGTSSEEHMKQDLLINDFTLSGEEVAQIDTISF